MLASPLPSSELANEVEKAIKSERPKKTKVKQAKRAASDDSAPAAAAVPSSAEEPAKKPKADAEEDGEGNALIPVEFAPEALQDYEKGAEFTKFRAFKGLLSENSLQAVEVRVRSPDT